MPAEPLSDATVLCRDPAAIEGELPEETVLLHVSSGASVRLNATAAWLWNELEGELGAGELAARLSSRYGLETERARRDVASFATDLGERGFLQISGPDGKPEA